MRSASSNIDKSEDAELPTACIGSGDGAGNGAGAATTREAAHVATRATLRFMMDDVDAVLVSGKKKKERRQDNDKRRR